MTCVDAVKRKFGASFTSISFKMQSYIVTSAGACSPTSPDDESDDGFMSLPLPEASTSRHVRLPRAAKLNAGGDKTVKTTFAVESCDEVRVHMCFR